ncbi:MAG TPA: hypothetical protein VLH85_09055 [Levilinea sp.]|nr:hypothetical protein [Levilinea sp.]
MGRMLTTGVLMLITLAIASCDFLTLPAVSQAAAPGSVLFSDDFSNPNSGWDTWSKHDSGVTYKDGALHIDIQEVQYSAWSRSGRRYDDAHIRVDAWRAGGPEDNDMGIICRYKDENNYYSFLISSDGYGGIVKVKDGQYHLLTGETLVYIEAIKTGSETNNIGADCVGHSLRLLVNGALVASAEDSDFITGEVGLIAGSYDLPGVEIAFDNFVVLKP